MHIDKDILLAWGGRMKKFRKHETVFLEGETGRCYFQIMEGCVKMYNINDNAGKEFTQGIFEKGNSFGEPPMFLEETYPATAVAVCDSVIAIVSRENFMGILKEYPEIHMKFTELMTRRLYKKAITFRELMSNSPATRIIGFLNSYKKENAGNGEKLYIPYTRQEIANLTGLRVETVIRTLQKMNEEGKVIISERKLYY